MRLHQIGMTVETARKAMPEIKKLDKAVKGIESMFLKDLLATMRKSVGKTSFGQGYGSELYQDMFDQALAESASKSGSLGIGTMVKRDFSKTIWRQALAQTRREVQNNLDIKP
ncbi:MAG TPA: rod-binding protein [Fimbriimonadaceae bacterium]|nr:rod-binding protein [Fimbriimonadaceae bacterium]